MISPWAALLALTLTEIPSSQSHAAAMLAQITQPTGPGGRGPTTPQTPPYGSNQPPNTSPNVTGGRANTSNPTDQPQQTAPRTVPLNPLEKLNDIPLIGRGNDRRTNRENDLSIPPLDPLERARELSDVPPRFNPTEPPVLPPPDNPDLRDQIDRLGTSIPEAPENPTAQTPFIGSAPLARPATRVIRPPVALPARRPASGVPPATERRLVADEVIVEVSLATPNPAIVALEQRNRLTRLDQLASQLSGTNLLRERIQDGRNVTAVVRALENDVAVMSAQPNYLFALQQENGAAREAYDLGLQYALSKLRLPEAHQLAMGENVPVAVIDSGIDVAHPELAGTIAGTFDTLDGSQTPHGHGTAVAGLVAAHARLMGVAPAARILAVRVFDGTGSSAQGSTFNVLKGLDWAAVSGARVTNMSFAGPSDPSVHRALEGAFRNGIVLVAAAGNAGPKSPPLYPGADPYVIAVMATDAQDKYAAVSNRGRYIGIAAPGVDILVAAPGGRYQILSGTSFSAAEVSGIAALMLQRKPDLTPDAVRRILLSTGRALAPQGGNVPFAARLPDAYQAISTDRVLPVAVR